MRLRIDADTVAALEQLEGSAHAASDLRPVADQLLEVFRGASARQFATGAGWPPSRKPSGLTLVKTGRLRDSWTRAGGDSRTTELTNEVVLETRVPYAAYLARGARGMPARDSSDVDRWRLEQAAITVLADYITGVDRR